MQLLFQLHSMCCTQDTWSICTNVKAPNPLCAHALNPQQAGSLCSGSDVPAAAKVLQLEQ